MFSALTPANTDPAPGDLGQPVRAWERIVAVNLRAHVWAARAVLPSMLARSGGYLLQTILVRRADGSAGPVSACWVCGRADHFGRLREQRGEFAGFFRRQPDQPVAAAGMHRDLHGR